MSSAFDHEDLRVDQAAIEFVAWHEEVAPGITSKVSACDHLCRASAGVPVNIAQASGKRSMSDRRQFIDTAYATAGHDGTQVWFDHEKLDVYRKALEFVA